MKRLYHVLLILIVSTISFKCQKELSNGNVFTVQPNNQPLPITATLQGNIIDENDQPAEGVLVSAGVKTATTNSHGYFRITDASLDKIASLVTADQPGYFKAYRTFSATSGVNQVVIKLIKKTLAGTVSATVGGNVSLLNGAKVSLPANGVNVATGGVYTGSINVYASYIDPTSTDIGKKVPGSFMGDDKNNNRGVLSSYGMLALVLESVTGEKLQIAPNSAATLTIPIPSSKISSAPATISLWYIDEASGIWKEQGTAKKTGSNYVGEVKHFSYWNADFNLPAVSFSAILKSPGGAPLSNTYVVIRTVADSGGYAHGYTDSLGQLGGLIPANMNLVLDVYDQCYHIAYSKNIGPFSSNTDLGTITIPNTTPSLFTIRGKLVNCSNGPVSNGYASMYVNNVLYNAGTNASGEFSIDILACSGTGQSFDIFGVDATTQQQGQTISIPTTGQVTNTGDIIACGTSTAQFINYTLDGKAFSISSLAGDSLSGVTYLFDSIYNSSNTTYISASSGNNFFNFDFANASSTGVYAIGTLALKNYVNNTLINPFNVNITDFPQTIGGFYEGNFSGSFNNDSPQVKHNINCSFRILRLQ
jgi:hypothetical protein